MGFRRMDISQSALNDAPKMVHRSTSSVCL